MAKIEIESTFVEAWNKNTEAHPSWGMKTAEPHSRKKDGGGYETVGRTFRTVKVPRDSSIDLTAFSKGDRVQVWGREVTETREHEGKKYYDLIVWADRVERVGQPSQPVQSQPEPAADVWNMPPADDSQIPF